MDKQTTLGFILIGLVLIAWMWLQTPTPRPPAPASQDSVALGGAPPRDTAMEVAPSAVVPEEPEAESPGKYFSSRTAGAEKVLTVKTDRYTAEITTKGGLIRKWELRDYLTWDKVPVQLVEFDQGGDLSLLFTSADGKLVNTRSLYFDADYRPWSTIELDGDASYTADLVLPVEGGGRLVKRLTFRNGSYSFDIEWRFVGMERVISNFEYQVIWEHGLRYAEENSVDESSFAMAYAMAGGELTEVDATTAGETAVQDINGVTSWVATRNKYFLLALLPSAGTSQGAFLEGVHKTFPNNGVKETYAVALKMPFKGLRDESARVEVYLGPLEYDIVRSYGQKLEETMNLGAAWIIRPISEYVMIPLFALLRSFIPNYGLVIIVFSLIIKIALHPLTRTSMKSMRKMQALTPMMNEIREKYKDNPEKMNQQVMNLYKEYGINPASGCLPLLLQMPILFALYSVLRSSIDLRQAHFVGWIRDLSIPDSVVGLPFTIPFFGISQISGLALAMGVTMFFQQKMSTTDPRQKAMIWMMPILLTLVFNNLPSGLNLYYFVFNLLSIAQQVWFNKQHASEPLRKVDPKKRSGGIMERLTRNLPKMR